MIWLRLFIAVIALTISSDLSAWAQTMQVNSPEGFYDCKGIANGANKRDGTSFRDCCLLTEMVFCGGCKDRRSDCEKQSVGWCGTGADKDINQVCCLPSDHTYEPHCGKCNYTKQGCESFPGRGCGQIAQGECSCDLSIKKVCGKCNYTKQGCESISGCGNIAQVPRPTVGCPTTRCRKVPSNNNYGWPMIHSHSRFCPSSHPYTEPDGGHLDFNHGQTFFHVTLSADFIRLGSVPCSGGRTQPALCSNPKKRGFIYATNPAGELITDAEAASASPRICCNGAIMTGSTCPAPLMYCRPQ